MEITAKSRKSKKRLEREIKGGKGQEGVGKERSGGMRQTRHSKPSKQYELG